MSKLNRRAILAGAAALPATALPAVATEPDPILAAIENHRRTYDEFGVAIKVLDLLEMSPSREEDPAKTDRGHSPAR